VLCGAETATAVAPAAIAIMIPATIAILAPLDTIFHDIKLYLRMTIVFGCCRIYHDSLQK
jgi:hypothetical protein